MSELKKSIPEKAYFTGDVQRINCDNCFEEYLFQFKDKSHEITIGLIDILRLVSFAEEEGAVPKFPSEWHLSIRRHYRADI